MSSIIIIYIYKCTISQKKALMLTCFSPFITVVRHICMCYTSYIRPLTASLYYARHTTNSLSSYSKKSVLSLVDEVFNDSDQMMVRSAAKHITFIAFTLKLLAPPKVHTTFQNWPKVRISWGNPPRYRLHIFDQFVSEFVFRFLEMQAVSVESPRAQ